MAVRNTKQGLWVADVTTGKRLDGSRDRKVRQFKTKNEAQRAEQALLFEANTKRGKSYGGILFEDFVENYFWPQKTS